MNVGIWAGYYFPHCGGYCKNIHELAKRLVEKGYEVNVVTCNTEKSAPREQIDGVQVMRVPMLAHPGGTMPIPGPSLMLLTLMQDEKYDVVITQSRIFLTSVLGAMYAKTHDVPLIHVERGSCHTILKSDFMSQLTKVYDHTVGSLITSKADRSVVISSAAGTFVAHLQQHTFPVIIHNGVDPVSDIKRDGKGSVTKIVFVGRLIYAKGVQDLIQSFSILASADNSLRLVIVGDGGHREELERLARRNWWHEDKIIFTGEVSQDKVIQILKECDIFVNPSYSEGLPTTVMEAASVALPIIATDVGGTSEIVHDGHSGLLVKPRDLEKLGSAMEFMIKNRAVANQMGNNAREIVKAFSWDRVTDQWDSLLKNVVRDKNKGEAKTSDG